MKQIAALKPVLERISYPSAAKHLFEKKWTIVEPNTSVNYIFENGGKLISIDNNEVVGNWELPTLSNVLVLNKNGKDFKSVFTNEAVIILLPDNEDESPYVMFDRNLVSYSNVEEFVANLMQRKLHLNTVTYLGDTYFYTAESKTNITRKTIFYDEKLSVTNNSFRIILIDGEYEIIDGRFAGLYRSFRH